MQQAQCPSPEELSTAFTHGGDDALYAHMGDCARCAHEWDSLDELRELAGELSFPDLSLRQRESTRDAILAGIDKKAPVSRPVRRRSYLMPAFAAVATLFVVVAAGVGWWAIQSDSTVTSGVAPVYLSQVHPQEGARFARVAASPNEIVRLHEGRVTVTVQRLEGDQRMRVITGDAEVEVRGTVFDVEVRDDKLRAVRVIEGVVEVRRESGVVRLTAGQRWDSPALAQAEVPIPMAPVVNNAATADSMAQMPQQQPDAPDLVVPIEVIPGPEQAPKVRKSRATAPRPSVVRSAQPARRARPRALRKRVRPKVTRSLAPAVVEVAPSPEPLESAKQPPAEPAERGDSLKPDAAEMPRDAGERSDAVESSAPDPLVDPVQLRFQEGWRALESGQSLTASKAFADVMDKSPSETLVADAAFWRTIALDRAGQSVNATAAMQDYLQRWPRSRRGGTVRAMLGWKLLESGDKAEAIALFQAAASDPNPRVRDSATAGLEAAERR